MKKEIITENIKFDKSCKGRKQHPMITSAKSAYRKYKLWNMTFNRFLEISQQPCHFCQTERSIKINIFSTRNRVSQYAKENGWWEYNYLLKLNNTDNIVSVCKSCKSYKRAEQKINKDTNENHHPSISSALVIYNRRYKQGTISFDEFLELSKEPCYFCKKVKSSKTNKYIYLEDASNYAKKNGWWEYNDLFKVNKKLPITLSNTIVVCKNCKRTKNRDRNRAQHPMISSAKIIYKNSYDDGDITFAQFLYLTKLPCHYCGKVKENRFNRFSEKRGSMLSSIKEGTFLYNGLDRIDSSFPHNLNNVVPACATCNFAKQEMSYLEFLHHIITVYNNLKLNTNTNLIKPQYQIRNDIDELNMQLINE